MDDAEAILELLLKPTPGNDVRTSRPAEVRPHSGEEYGSLIPLGGALVHGRGGQARNDAVVEGLHLKSARIKAGISVPLTDREQQLMTRWPEPITPDEVIRRLLEGEEVLGEPDVGAPPVPDPVEVAGDEAEETPDPPVPAEAAAVPPEPQEAQTEETLIGRPIKVDHPLARPDGSPREILRLLVGRWKRGWVEWESETLVSEVRRVFGVKIHAKALEKVMVLSLLFQSDRFWEEWQVFQAGGATLAGRQARFDDVQILSLAEIDAALHLANGIRLEKFSEEVLAYIAGTAHLEGIVYLPPPLDLAQEPLDVLTGHPPLVNEVVKAWEPYETMDPTVAESQVIREDAVGVQIARLLAIRAASRHILES